jgi:hypothetical protein
LSYSMWCLKSSHPKQLDFFSKVQTIEQVLLFICATLWYEPLGSKFWGGIVIDLFSNFLSCITMSMFTTIIVHIHKPNDVKLSWLTHHIQTQNTTHLQTIRI